MSQYQVIAGPTGYANVGGEVYQNGTIIDLVAEQAAVALEEGTVIEVPEAYEGTEADTLVNDSLASDTESVEPEVDDAPVEDTEGEPVEVEADSPEA